MKRVALLILAAITLVFAMGAFGGRDFFGPWRTGNYLRYPGANATPIWDSSARKFVWSSGGAGATTIVNTEATNAVSVDQNADAGNSTSTGGAVLIENTGNVGAGLIVYSNIGATADGRLAAFTADNTAFDQQIVRITNDGTNAALSIAQNTTGGTVEAVSITSADTTMTTLGASGAPTAKGMVKFTHSGTSAVNSNGSAVSVAVTSTSNDAQGIFVDQHSTGRGLNVDADTDSASDTTAVYVDAVNAGAGNAIGIHVVNGGVQSGSNSSVRGTVSAWDGSSDAPGCLVLYSADGTAYYIFVDNTGDLKIHTSLPGNADGSVVGDQS